MTKFIFIFILALNTNSAVAVDPQNIMAQLSENGLPASWAHFDNVILALQDKESHGEARQALNSIYSPLSLKQLAKVIKVIELTDAPGREILVLALAPKLNALVDVDYMNALIDLLQRLPDSEVKINLALSLKGFSYVSSIIENTLLDLFKSAVLSEKNKIFAAFPLLSSSISEDKKTEVKAWLVDRVKEGHPDIIYKIIFLIERIGATAQNRDFVLSVKAALEGLTADAKGRIAGDYQPSLTILSQKLKEMTASAISCNSII